AGRPGPPPTFLFLRLPIRLVSNAFLHGTLRRVRHSWDRDSSEESIFLGSIIRRGGRNFMKAWVCVRERSTSKSRRRSIANFSFPTEEYPELISSISRKIRIF